MNGRGYPRVDTIWLGRAELKDEQIFNQQIFKQEEMLTKIT